jgi:hypothetical protein
MVITYSENIFVGFSIQQAMRMCHIVIYGLSGSVIIFYIISQTAWFSENSYQYKMCFDFLYNFRLKYF